MGNDDTADWLAELEETSALSLLKSSLNSHEAEGGYLEAPEDARILCAADTLLTALDPQHSSAPPEARAWLKGRSGMNCL